MGHKHGVRGVHLFETPRVLPNHHPDGRRRILATAVVSKNGAFRAVRAARRIEDLAAGVAAPGIGCRSRKTPVSMDRSVTRIAERDQVLFGVVPETTAEFLVVDFQVGHCAAGLTSPAVAPQHLPAQILVGHGIKP